jgi:hypothetical protein
MPHEHHVVQVLVLQHVHHVEDVRLQARLRCAEMRALAQAGQRRRVDIMTGST